MVTLAMPEKDLPFPARLKSAIIVNLARVEMADFLINRSCWLSLRTTLSVWEAVCSPFGLIKSKRWFLSCCPDLFSIKTTSTG